MRLEGVKNVLDANKYLQKYLKQHNQKFSVKAREAGDQHQIFTTENDKHLERYFAKESVRTIK
ncbi:MAG: hypothetical protein LBI53_07155 [Candidatus Peribacteria bacterium]|jgi:hypothetical protein|nr:hypothetical protein [Candidatus Peribacteria bacterium]